MSQICIPYTMYFVRKIRKTKKHTSKSSFIVSFPKKLERRIASYDDKISSRLANFARFRYFYEDVENPRCFLLSIWDCEIPPNGVHDKASTTTMQRSGKTSRYVIIPKKVCSRFGWGAGTELVIGFDSQIDEYVHDAIYKNDDCFLKGDTPSQEVHPFVIKFQRYHDMKKLYRAKLARRKEELAKEESNAYWNTRNSPLNYDIAMKRIQYVRKNIHRLVWNKLESMNLVAVSYSDFVKIRAEMERERKQKRRQFLQKRFGARSTWRYRKDIVRSGRRYGYDYDARRENILDDPDSYIEAKGDDPVLYGEERSESNDSYYKDESEEDF
ncbi:MAG: hypothetical protein KGH88_08105 [Thaumarchaeota archaeon]|nr:hypothetical protein [Nitrososphaerota archaeon]